MLPNSPPATTTPFALSRGRRSPAATPSGKYNAVIPFAASAGCSGSCVSPNPFAADLMRCEAERCRAKRSVIDGRAGKAKIRNGMFSYHHQKKTHELRGQEMHLVWR